MGISALNNTGQFICYTIAIAAFGLAAIGISLHEKVTNLVALGLFAVTFVSFWGTLANL